MRWAGIAAALAMATGLAGAQGRGPRSGALHPFVRGFVTSRTFNTALVPQPLVQGWSRAQHGGFGPNGSTFGFAGLGCSGQFPANCDLAIGPDDVVQAVNGQIAFFDRDGTQTFLASSAGFFPGLSQTASPDQPRASFDPATQRFFLIFSEHDASSQISDVLLAVSDDSDPAGSWSEYRIDTWRTSGNVAYWMERPGLGYNDMGVVVTGTYFKVGTGAPGGSAFFVASKAPLLTGSAVTVFGFLDSVVNYAQATDCPGTSAFVFGATQLSSTFARIYGVEHAGEASTVVVFHDQGTITTPVPPNTAPSTDGGSLETNGGAVVAVAWRNDRLFMAVNAGTPGPQCGVRWSAFATENFGSGSAPSVLSGLVSSSSEFYFLPALAVNRFTDAALLFTGSSAQVTSDALTAGRIASDAVTFMSAPFVATSAGGTPYLDTRWGGYIGAGVDPVDGETFWGTAMVVRADGRWDTRVLSWNVSKTWPVAPASYSLFRGSLVSGDLGSLLADDGDYLVLSKGLVLNASEPPIQIVVDAFAPSGQVLGVGLDVIANASTPGLSQRAQLFNWGTGMYDTVGTVGATLSDSLQSASAPGTGSAYVQSGTGAVRARVQWFQSGIVLNNAWRVAVDKVQWRVRVR